MALSDYQIALYDPSTGGLLDVLDARRIEQLRYSRKLNDVGKFSLTIRGEDPAANYKQTRNLMVDIYRRNTATGDLEREDTYFLRKFEILEDNGQDYVILGGEHVHRLFRDRRIFPDDDPNGANGYSTKSGVADLVMYDYVLDQVISPAINTDRAEPITNAPSMNLGLPIFQRKSIQNTLLSVLQEATVLGGVDFTLVRTTGANFLFTVGIVGRDVTYTSNYPSTPFVLYKPEFRNTKNPRFSDDYSKEVNIVYVGTQGIESDRLFTPVSIPNVSLPFNRSESVTDAREIDDVSVLNAVNTAGYEFLRTKEEIIKFTFDIETTISRYNIDWFLGDRLTAMYQDYMQDVRVEEVEIEISGDSENIRPRFQQETL